MNLTQLDYQFAVQAELDRINIDPVYISVMQRDTKDNGYGVLVPDLTKPLYQTSFGPMRIVPTSSPILSESAQDASIALSTEFILFTQPDVDWLTKDMVFEARDRKYKVVESKVIYAFGGAISVVAGITDVTKDKAQTTVVALGSTGTVIVVGAGA